MRKILLTLVMFCMIGVVSGCSNKAEELDNKIETVLSSDEILQEQLDEIFLAYDNLSDNQKEKVTNYDKIEKYKDVNIEDVNEINNTIKKIEKLSFSEILDLDKSITTLTSNEKALIDVSKVDAAMELSDMEKAAVAACQYIRKSLKSSSSFKLQSAKVIDDLADIKYYLVKIEYSGTNSFGGEKDANSFQTINSEFVNPWYGLAVLNGKYEEALECSSFLQYYLLNDQEPTELDCDKIMYYIDEAVN